MTAAVIAVDGGNSKTDLALVGGDGRLLAAVRGPTVSHQVVGLEQGARELGRLVARAAAEAGLPSQRPVAGLGVYCLAGADFPSDVRSLRRELGQHRFSAEDVILNDCFAALRAGAEAGWGIALICGQGINGAGVAPGGRTARFAGIGPLSGDWGGAGSIGSAALGSAIRARDGRGARTTLERTVARHFGLASPEAVMLAMYEERLPSRRLSELSPLVFADAEAGDAVARGIIDGLADELAIMALALLRRLRLVRSEVEVVLAGGVFAARDPGFHERLAARIHAAAPRARLVRLDAPPVLGAALIGLDRLSPTGIADRRAAGRLRDAFRQWRRRR